MTVKKVVILGVPFDNITMREAVQKSILALKKASRLFVATPNPEMLLEAKKNAQFKTVLQRTDLNLPDGSGLILASKWQQTPLLERVSGVDYMLRLIDETAGKYSVFLLGAAPGVAEKAGKELEKKYHARIVGAFPGSPAPDSESEIIQLINHCRPDILFVAYGAPAQELWLGRNLSKLPSVKIACGVGGAFDFIAGVKKRAPRIMQKLYLEWLFRLMQEPRRLRRIINATIVFPVIFFSANRHKKRG